MYIFCMVQHEKITGSCRSILFQTHFAIGYFNFLLTQVMRIVHANVILEIIFMVVYISSIGTRVYMLCCVSVYTCVCIYIYV